jgi:hypothetical protein
MNSIQSELEKTISTRVLDVLASLEKWTKSVCQELSSKMK